MNLHGRTALVTGAAGGLGQAICRALAARGARLIVSGRRAETLEPLAAEVGGRVLIADLADRAALEPMLAEAGRIDVLVANAGLPADGPLDDYSVAEIDRALDVNLRAPILTAQALLDGMRERGEGHMVFVSSLLGKFATPGTALYSATKFGLRGFAMGLRADLVGTGVGVSTVFPGFIRDAGMFAQAEVDLPRGVGTATPSDVANAVVRAIERNRAEIDVAPVSMRLATAVASVVPGPAATLNRRVGADEISAQISGSEAHRSRR